MVRFILKLPPREHIGQVHLDSIKLLRIHDRVKQLRLNHVFNVFHSSGPIYLQQFFTRISDSHSHRTRSSSYNFHVPRVSGLASHSFYYQSTLDWNSLPNTIKSIDDKNSFKSKIKSHLSTIAMNQELAEFVQLISIGFLLSSGFYSPFLQASFLFRTPLEISWHIQSTLWAILAFRFAVFI